MKVISREAMLADALDLFYLSLPHRRYTVADLQTYLMLPLRYNTLRVYYLDDVPVGLVTWCWMTEENGKAFLQDKYHPTPEDHDSSLRDGKQLWGVEFITPYGHARPVMNQIKQECVETYGQSDIYWRRFSNRTHKRRGKFQ